MFYRRRLWLRDNALGTRPMNETVGKEFEELDRRRASHRKWFYSRWPKRIENVIAQLVQRRGYAQVRVAGERDEAWKNTVGEQLAAETQVSSVRRGAFEVLVANSLLMQELTFRKEAILIQLQEALPEAGIKQVKFRLAQLKR